MKIGIVYPAGPVKQQKVSEALEAWGGSATLFEPSVPSPLDYLAAPDGERAQQLLKAASTMDLLWAVRGGYGSMRILPLLGEAMGDALAPLVGFSDITALLLTWHDHGVPAIHGPVLTQYPRLDRRSRILMDGLLAKGTLPSLTFELSPVRPGEASGPVLAGNLTVLASLCGTPYGPDLAGKIVILEDVGEPPYRIDRALTQLHLSANLGQARAIVLGDFDTTPPSLVARMVASLVDGVPVYVGMPVGHGEANVPVPIGVEAVLHHDTLQIPRFSLDRTFQ